ncbi:MAG TPA: DUF642 domain-containing protein [Candidatus Limnocylindrales bacterium]|nr:DUF642 domain-containing protein [Candidatus Limnocylindrales bacterium]
MMDMFICRWRREALASFVAMTLVGLVTSPALAGQRLATRSGLVAGAAWADSVKVSPDVKAIAGVDSETCKAAVVVTTHATFDRAARLAEVRIAFEGINLPGKYDSHNLGGATEDTFVFRIPAEGARSGSYTVKADWAAQTGNGLSRGTAAATGPLVIPVRDMATEPVSLETKCEAQKLADMYRDAAGGFGLGGETTRNACAECSKAMFQIGQLFYNEYKADLDIVKDPPDPNFTTLSRAVVPVVETVVAAPGISPEAATALNGLIQLVADNGAQARAALAAIEKAQGAHAAHDTSWERRQQEAAAGFLRELAAGLDQLPAAMSKAGTALKAAGFPNPVLDKAAADAYVAKAKASGLPSSPTYPNWLRDQAGRTDAEIKAIVDNLPPWADKFKPMPLLDTFSASGLTATVSGTTARLNADADALLASSQAGQSKSPSPSASVRPTAVELPSLLKNSGFEEPALARGASYQTLTAGKQPSPTGWALKKGSIDIVASGSATAATGGQFIDLNGNDTTAGVGTITQEVAVKSGHGYRLSFQMAGNPNGAPQVKTVQVSLGDQQQTFTFDTKGHTNADLGWITHTMQYCGSASTVTVAFTSLTEGIRGPNLDNVALTETGESCGAFPVWLFVVIGLVAIAGGAAVFLYLRHRRSRGMKYAATQELSAAA